MNDSVRKCLPHLLWVLGLITFCGAIVYFGPDGIPYQDATEEQLNYQAEQLDKATVWVVSALVLFSIGAIWAFSRWIWYKGKWTQLSFILAPLLIWGLYAGWFEWSWFGGDHDPGTDPAACCPLHDRGRAFYSGGVYKFFLPLALLLSFGIGFICSCAWLASRNDCRDLESVAP